MSPRAAWRLESLGFRDVYDYVAGKVDWLAAGLPTEGPVAEEPRVGALARSDVPTCGLKERVAEVRGSLRTRGWDRCVVVNEERVVLGMIRADALEDASLDALAEEIMSPGPSTFRPNVSVTEMADYMSDHNLTRSPVTTSDGRLVGLLFREDAERVARQAHSGHHGP